MLKADYDRRADVLYLYKDRPRPALTEEGADGLMLRFAIDDEKPCGITVLAYRRNWLDHRDLLAEHVSKFLDIEQKVARSVLNKIKTEQNA
jgi:uncharacterized protein YuzE